MGIKEFEHLKKSLSEISSKISKVKKSEKKLDDLYKELAAKREGTKDSQTYIMKWQKESKNQLEKVGNTDPGEKLKTELAEIREEIYQIEAEMEQTNKRKRIRNSTWGDEYPRWWVWGIIGWYLFFLLMDSYYDSISKVELSYPEQFLGWCGFPIVFGIMMQYITKSKLKSELLDGETIKRYKSLKGKENYRWKKIKKYQDEKTWLEELEGKKQFHIERNRKNLDRIETILASIKDTEQLIEKLNKDIEETYESIKHLIPYSEYL